VLAVLLSLSISTIGVFAYWTFSHKIIKLLFGAGYLSAEPYLGIFALFMLLYSLVYIFAWFFVSISQFKLGSLVIISAILQFVGLHYFHKSISEVILVSMLSVGSVAVIYIIVFTRIYYLYWVKLQKTSTDIL
jgi:O-antigen/teichoic acid export membrane protein